MAVAGFSDAELNIVTEPNKLVVEGQKADSDSEEREYLYRGIAARSFREVFNLADHVKVTGASLNDGLLTIELAREIPEALKPRQIQVTATRNQGGDQVNRVPQAKVEGPKAQKAA